MKDLRDSRRDVFFESRTGRKKSLNEDCYGEAFAAGNDLDFLFVSDGMGGHLAGEVASGMTCGSLGAAFSGAVFENEDMKKLFIENAIIKADLEIADDSASNPQHSRMGATLVLAALDLAAGNALVCNIGDSRCYHYGEGGLRQITKDHSLKQQLIDRGFAPEEIPPEAHRNAVTRAMGFLCTEKGRPRIDLYEVPFGKDDLFILCSDGLTSVLSNETLEKALAERRGLDSGDICRALADMAGAAGSDDDITVAVVRILKTGRGEAGTDGEKAAGTGTGDEKAAENRPAEDGTKEPAAREETADDNDSREETADEPAAREETEETADENSLCGDARDAEPETEAAAARTAGLA